jgi:hypothetical protein
MRIDIAARFWPKQESSYARFGRRAAAKIARHRAAISRTCDGRIFKPEGRQNAARLFAGAGIFLAVPETQERPARLFLRFLVCRWSRWPAFVFQ